MRVVAGSARGRLLVAPPGTATRPTSDKVRQAMFNALESAGWVEGATMVDLFAGSGALGIEALSRGARHVTFLDTDRAARACIERNLAVVAGSDHRLLAGDAIRFCQGCRAPSAGHGGTWFDVALADPPYRFEGWSELLAVVPADVVVIETDREFDLGPEWETMRSRTYGGTVVVFAQRADRHPE